MLGIILAGTVLWGGFYILAEAHAANEPMPEDEDYDGEEDDTDDEEDGGYAYDDAD